MQANFHRKKKIEREYYLKGPIPFKLLFYLKKTSPFLRFPTSHKWILKDKNPLILTTEMRNDVNILNANHKNLQLKLHGIISSQDIDALIYNTNNEMNHRYDVLEKEITEFCFQSVYKVVFNNIDANKTIIFGVINRIEEDFAESESYIKIEVDLLFIYRSDDDQDFFYKWMMGKESDYTSSIVNITILNAEVGEDNHLDILEALEKYPDLRNLYLEFSTPESLEDFEVNYLEDFVSDLPNCNISRGLHVYQ